MNLPSCPHLHRAIENGNHGFFPHCVLCNKIHLVFMGQQLADWAVMQLSPALLNCWVSPMISGGQKHTLGFSLFLGVGQGVS